MNPENHIIHVALATPLRHHFDYLPPENVDKATLQVGMRVLVPFGKQNKVGIIIGFDQQSDLPVAKLKPISEVLDQEPLLDSSIIALCEWASRYYQHPLGEVLHAALPTLARKPGHLNQSAHEHFYANVFDKLPKLSPRQRALYDTLLDTPGLTGIVLKQQGFSPKIVRTLVEKAILSAAPCAKQDEQGPVFFDHVELALNEDQENAVNSINRQPHFDCFLLNGVTGSGKTEVYLRTIAQRLQRGQQAIVLVPEIGLTPQTIERFTARFKVPIVALHSRLSENDRLQAWLEAKSGRAKIIIGTRSAILTPAPNLGIIILDEEHDLSFKQQSRFRYSARDLAIMRCKLLNIPIIMGSATPSLESLYNVNQKRFTELRLPERAGVASAPQYKVVDLRQVKLQSGLCPELINTVKTHLNANNQVLLFLNRRGFSPLLLCHACGWTADCPHCDAKLTFHQQKNRLCCHHCGTERPRYTQCLQCQSDQLITIGLGTERLEQELTKLFPDTEIIRIDQDTTRGNKTVLIDMLEKIQNGERQILIGTQMLAKGHHFPNVTLVGLVDVDNALFSSDFRALERLGQLIVQVAGRAGRVEKQGTVFIQTHNPEHPLLTELLTKGYQHFAKSLLQERQTVNLPPYSYLAVLQAECEKPHQLNEFLNQARIDGLEISAISAIKLIGPMPSPMGRKAGRHRSQLIIQGEQRHVLQQWLAIWIKKLTASKLGARVRWVVDVDPLEMS
jgi:primosomal protein N' (replication factor Y)